MRSRLVLVVGVILVGSGVLAAVMSPGSSGTPVFEMPLESFEGETVRIGDYRGRPLVINYFASWCGPCREELPDFEEAYRLHEGRVQFLGINVADDPAAGLDLLNEFGVSYDAAIDRDSSTYAAFGGYGMPTTVFVSAEGSVIEVHSGMLTAEDLEDRIVAHFTR